MREVGPLVNPGLDDTDRRSPCACEHLWSGSGVTLSTPSGRVAGHDAVVHRANIGKAASRSLKESCCSPA
jgi:hypothetical protein